MKFEVYCDESYQDVLTSLKPRARYLMIGSLWLQDSLRPELKQRVKELREKHQAWGEFKWTKVSNNRKDFYFALIDLFMAYGENLRFRCIAVDREQYDPGYHNNDGELGFYKLYYQLLRHWILDYNCYRIFCDVKTNRDPSRLPVLAECLSNSCITSKIESIQSLPSHDVVLVQLCDVLLGCASAKLNNKLGQGTLKALLVDRLEGALGRELQPTQKGEEKFNIFKIRLAGGW